VVEYDIGGIKEMPQSWDDLPMFLTAKQVADFLQLHVNTVKGWCRAGKLQALKIGKAWRIPKESLRAFMDTAPQYFIPY